MCYPTLGQLYEQTGRAALAEQSHKIARDSIEQLAREYPSAGFLKTFATDRRVLAMVYPARRGENLPKLITEADALARRKDLSALSCYNLACFYALASAAMKTDASAAESQARSAMELLARAEKNGFFGRGVARDLVKNDDDLKSLGKREDFKALLKRLEGDAERTNSGSSSR
jgi:hypothetical protein